MDSALRAALAHAPVSRAAPRPAWAPVQAKLRIGPVDDPLEHEADRAADAVMHNEPVGNIGRAQAAPQRKCAECEAEEGREPALQRKCAGCGGGVGHASADAAARAVSSGGAPLSPHLRAYFEPRFGRDLSQVRIHTGAGAASAARGIGARAYTLGSNIAFATGEYEPVSQTGRHLMAHELAHVAQQGEAAPQTVRRTVAATSNCPPNVNGALADPLADLRTADAEARRMAMGASHLLGLWNALNLSESPNSSYVFQAYQRRFHGAGPATAPADAGRFENRFDGHVFDTQPEASAAEMSSLADRFREQHDFLTGAIQYRCPGLAPITWGGCVNHNCLADDFARSCIPQDAMTIVICPHFWERLSVPQRAAVIVHESVHMRLNFLPHDRATIGQRGENPECYASLILDLYREGAAESIRSQFDIADPNCPP